MLSRYTSTYINKYQIPQSLIRSCTISLQSRLVSSTPSLIFIPSFSSPTTITAITSRSMSTLSNGHSSGTSTSSHPYEYDLIVIGGGSGGLAASKEAAKLNPKAKIAVLDYVQPTVYGTRWGLGGTCVNVGCVPKKLMHYASLLGSQFPAAEQFGWTGLNNTKHEWGPMVELITNYIKSLNFSYRSSLRGAGITYIEGYCTFTDPHTLAWTGAKNKKGVITGNKFLIATGGRPNMGTTLGKELAISSDDLFWLKKSPGKTLVIGAGYIALECAGFLHHIGNDISVMVRGEFMRKFDKQSGQQIGELMERSGIRFIMPATSVRYYKKKENWVKAPEGSTPGPDGSLIFPVGADGIHHIQHASGAIQSRDPKTGLSTWKIPEGRIVVEYVYANDSSKTIHREEYDTILQATGRTACVDDLNLPVAGVRIANGKILVDEAETTTANHIYAIGDVATGVKQHLPEHHVKNALVHSRDRPELTPVAIQAGIHWARRVFGGAKDLMAYHLIPTTVFTPDEYAFTGLTEEEAERDEKDGGIGAENVEIFWSRYGSLEISPQHPPVIEPRSRHFIDQHFYPRIYAEKNKLWWPETGFDVDSNSSILLDNTSTGLITSRYQSSSGNWIYDVTLDDGSIVKEISGNRLRINPTLAQDEVEVFMKANCLAKLICDRRRNNLVVGIHYIGPNAGEIMQGFALGLQLGATKQHFDKLVGIHPTAAEEFTVLTVTKSSGASYFKKAGCGGGSCG